MPGACSACCALLQGRAPRVCLSGAAPAVPGGRLGAGRAACGDAYAGERVQGKEAAGCKQPVHGRELPSSAWRAPLPVRPPSNSSPWPGAAPPPCECSQAPACAAPPPSPPPPPIPLLPPLQLTLVHGQIISLLTSTALNALFARNPGYDARNLLGAPPGPQLRLPVGAPARLPAAVPGAGRAIDP